MINTTNSSRVGVWVLAIRPKTLPAAAAPVLVGAGAAAAAHRFSIGPIIAAFLGALLFQIGANLANDVFDHRRGADTAERLGPTRVTQAGLLTPGAVLAGMWLVFALSIPVGLYLAHTGGWPVVAIGLTAIVAAIAYTGGPFPLGYNGLGEVFVFLFFGLAAVCGTCFVSAGYVTEAAWLAALPIGFLAMAILVVNNLRDLNTDRAAGKRTLAVRFGRQGTITEYSTLLALAYIVPVVMFAVHASRPWVLLTWLSLPLAAVSLKNVRTLEGRPLNQVLANTARLELVYGVLLAVGLVLSR
ncbi:MAG: 1,4-dihydroxy-2-naphthoate polyprenyltransferase [Janthinobacterium lividum]